MNTHLTGPLSSLLAEYELQLEANDFFRSRTLSRAIAFLTRLPLRVETVAQWRTLTSSMPPVVREGHGLGAATTDKVAQLLTTGTLAKLEGRRRNELLTATSDFRRVWGIGGQRARWLTDHPNNLRTLDELRVAVGLPPSAPVDPNPPGRVPPRLDRPPTHNDHPILQADSLECLAHLDDLSQRIPRAEVTQIVAAVAHAAVAVYGRGKVEVVCCGSYRRSVRASCCAPSARGYRVPPGCSF